MRVAGWELHLLVPEHAPTEPRAFCIDADRGDPALKDFAPIPGRSLQAGFRVGFATTG